MDAGTRRCIVETTMKSTCRELHPPSVRADAVRQRCNTGRVPVPGDEVRARDLKTLLATYAQVLPTDEDRVRTIV